MSIYEMTKQLKSSWLFTNYNTSMMVFCTQEAKSSCAGQWYLPAGRMEPGEEVTEAAIREVKEETGLDFEPSTLLSIEAAGKF